MAIRPTIVVPGPRPRARVLTSVADGPVDIAHALSTAAEQGRISALAAGGQRDLAERAAAHPALFSAKPFDGTLFSAVALATAYGAPWCTREQLVVANRVALWIFAVDWWVDYLSHSPDEADALLAGCLAVADGAEPTDPLGRFLAEIRDTLAASPAFPRHRAAWRTELERMLAAMARERRWKVGRDTDGSLPSVDGYLANADNFGSSFVNISHWIALAEPDTLAHLAELMAASRTVQRVLRLVNDLATYERDLTWGDLNVLMLGPDRAAVTARIERLVEECLLLLEALSGRCPREAVYLARQIGFSSGFYRVGDFWGRL
jgi:hypothetical protein